jgi:hypothetical protein
MKTTLVVDEHNELIEVRKREFLEQPKAIRIAATIISYIFHPVFIPVYIVYFLLFNHPYLFAGYDQRNKLLVLAQAFMMLTFFPLVSIFLLKALNFIESIYLHTQKDRVIPFIACMTWYFWLWYVWNNMGKSGDQADIPPEAVQLALAIFISTIIGLMANIKFKISLHAIGVGVMLTFIILLGLSQGLSAGMYISVAVLVTGLVLTSRFIVSDHTSFEVYAGFAAGIISMLLGHLLG